MIVLQTTYWFSNQRRSLIKPAALRRKGDLILRIICPALRLSIWSMALCLFSQTAPFLASPAVSFELVDGRLIIVPVLISNSGPYNFMLDTESNATLVDPQL